MSKQLANIKILYDQEDRNVKKNCSNKGCFVHVLTSKTHQLLENKRRCLSFALAQYLSLQLCPIGMLSYEGMSDTAVP